MIWQKKTLPRVTGSHPMQGWFLWHSLSKYVIIWMQMAADVIRCCILCEQPRKFRNYCISDSALDLSCSWLSHQVTLILSFIHAYKQPTTSIHNLLIDACKISIYHFVKFSSGFNIVITFARSWCSFNYPGK